MTQSDPTAGLTPRGERVRVGIAEFAVADGEKRLVTSGLGSCVGVALLDSDAEVRGLAHVMLPDGDDEPDPARPAKYAGPGVRLLLEAMAAEGADPDRVTARLAGGSQMLSLSSGVGERNVEAVRAELDALDIPVESAEVGGSEGRSLVFTTGGELLVNTAGE